MKPSLIVVFILASNIYLVAGHGAYLNALTKLHRFSGNKHEKNESQPFVDQPPRIETNGNLPELDEAFSKCNGIDIRELTIHQVQKLFDKKLLTSLELTKCYLTRIQKMNSVLRAVIVVNPDAIVEAHTADLERWLPRSRDPIHGIPILIKDNVAIFDFMDTTAGSQALKGLRPSKTADIIEILRKRGAVILGNANLSEFAYFRGIKVPSGWSGVGGQTRNPYNLNQTPCGSSAGSATGVAANLAMVAVGSETDGSLICPSEIQGLFTIKPTIHLVSTRAVIPISFTQDNLGPMARSVTDMTILLDAMVPPSDHLRGCGGSYASCLLSSEKNKEFRVGVPRYPFWDLSALDSPALEFELPYYEQILRDMSNLPDVRVIDPVTYDLSLLTQISGLNELVVLLHEFKDGINAYLRNNVIGPYDISYTRKNGTTKDVNFEKRIATLKDIIEYNNKNPTAEGYDQEILIMAEATDGLKNQTYLDALQSNRDGAREFFDYLFNTYHLDAVVAPSEIRINEVTNPALRDAPILAYSVAAIAGYPSVNVPTGFIGWDGVPFGLTLIGRPNSELGLLQLALKMEEILPQRPVPKFEI